MSSLPFSGVLSTGGNLVFGTTSEGQVFALQGDTGKLLWRFQAGSTARGNAMSYMSDGKQHVAVTVGNSLYAFAVE